MKSFFHFSKSYHLVKNIKKTDTILKVFGKSFLIITVVKYFVLMSGHGFGLVKYSWGMGPMFDFLFFFFLVENSHVLINSLSFMTKYLSLLLLSGRR